MPKSAAPASTVIIDSEDEDEDNSWATMPQWKA